MSCNRMLPNEIISAGSGGDSDKTHLMRNLRAISGILQLLSLINRMTLACKEDGMPVGVLSSSPMAWANHLSRQKLIELPLSNSLNTRLDG